MNNPLIISNNRVGCCTNNTVGGYQGYQDGVAYGYVNEFTIYTGSPHSYSLTIDNCPPPYTYCWTYAGLGYPSPFPGFNSSCLSTNSEFIFNAPQIPGIYYITLNLRFCNDQDAIGWWIKLNVINQPCVTECVIETVDIPSSRLNYLIDTFNNLHTIPEYPFFECIAESRANNKAVFAIENYLRGQANCQNSQVKVTWSLNGNSGNCVKLKIENSPIKFVSANLGGT